MEYKQVTTHPRRTGGTVAIIQLLGLTLLGGMCIGVGVALFFRAESNQPLSPASQPSAWGSVLDFMESRRGGKLAAKVAFAIGAALLGLVLYLVL